MFWTPQAVHCIICITENNLFNNFPQPWTLDSLVDDFSITRKQFTSETTLWKSSRRGLRRQRCSLNSQSQSCWLLWCVRGKSTICSPRLAWLRGGRGTSQLEWATRKLRWMKLKRASGLPRRWPQPLWTTAGLWYRFPSACLTTFVYELYWFGLRPYEGCKTSGSPCMVQKLSWDKVCTNYKKKKACSIILLGTCGEIYAWCWAWVTREADWHNIHP